MTLNEDIKEKILNYLTHNWPRDKSIIEISREIAINRSTVSRYIPVLIVEGEVKFTRKVGKAKMFMARHSLLETIRLSLNHEFKEGIVQEHLSITETNEKVVITKKKEFAGLAKGPSFDEVNNFISKVLRGKTLDGKVWEITK